MFMKLNVSKDDLLFHAVHGLCRVKIVTKPSGSEEANYTLLPVTAGHGKVRFMISESSLENSGFAKLISVIEANEILNFLKTGSKKASSQDHAWAYAETVRSESCSAELVKDRRKSQLLDRSLKSLASELSFVLNYTLKETADKIQKNLAALSKINPMVLSALANVDRI